MFNRGDGRDTIYDYDRAGSVYSYFNGGNDTITFGAGISAADIAIYKNGSSLLLSYGNNDVINITESIYYQ